MIFNYSFAPRRDRKLFAEVRQSVMNTSWVKNEISRNEIKNSSLVLTSISSRKGMRILPSFVSTQEAKSASLGVVFNIN